VNFATFWQFGVRQVAGKRRRFFADLFLPVFGFLFCGVIWWNLNKIAQIVGGVWFAIGIVYVGIKTKGFRQRPVMIDFGEA
jgi:putrescine importer